MYDPSISEKIQAVYEVYIASFKLIWTGFVDTRSPGLGTDAPPSSGGCRHAVLRVNMRVGLFVAGGSGWCGCDVAANGMIFVAFVVTCVCGNRD